MYIDLSGEWKISLEADEGKQSGVIRLPGILQAAGYGNPVTRQTPWVSSLHDSFWYEQEEYKYAQEEGVNVPFLSQPPRHFLGQAVYEKTFVVPGDAHSGREGKGCQAPCVAEDSVKGGAPAEEWHFHVELARWRSQVWIDGKFEGEDCSLCGPHDIKIGRLAAGEHTLRVVIDNSMLYPYRPDAHGVSDALGGTWNGMAGEIALFTEDISQERRRERQEYARLHPRKVEAEDGRFLVDGEAFYFRGTHFGGEYPLTGYPSTDRAWWRRIMEVIWEWGLNGIRFHSCCPPEAAFAAADEAGMALLVECGMWNRFGEDAEGEEMYQVLMGETRRILENFGHHPSFMFFSPSNEPSGPWYQPLRRWVREAKAYDRELGYGGRRLCTAQSGWPYEVPPEEVEGTDFIYFHRSGNGFRKGGMIRGHVGWKGGDYSAVLPGAKLPVVCHELGQICAYPDYAVTEKFQGYLQPGNYKVFRENARANGILPYAEDFVRCSGENQLRLYKEELEANFRTPELQGFELLDLHDYLGQGTALVGILDVFWENKGYGDPARFRQFCGDTVLLARCGSYVWKSTDTAVIPVEICHYGEEEFKEGVLRWSLKSGGEVLDSAGMYVGEIPRGCNTRLGEITLSFGEMGRWDDENCVGMPLGNEELTLEVSLVLPAGDSRKRSGAGRHCTVFGDPAARGEGDRSDGNGLEAAGVRRLSSWPGGRLVRNSWNLYVYAEPSEEMPEESEDLLYTRDWQRARQALEKGWRVVYSPWQSDLNYECPALSGGSVGWNSQMGPTWCRTMGVVVDEKHPVFNNFPTGRSGGWQWEDILKHSRGFHMEGLEQVKPIVQPIDDWNRGLLLGLIFEARICGGKLLVVSANLEGTFEKRPAAYCLKQALLKYAASEAFAPAVEADPEAIERKLFPMLRMQTLAKAVSYGGADEEKGMPEAGADGGPKDGKAADGMPEKGREVKNGMALVEADPNTSAKVTQDRFPVVITITLQKTVAVRGILYVPEQRDREHEGFAREYRIEVRNNTLGRWEKAAEGVFLNTSRSQQVLFDREVETDTIRLFVLSAYGCVDKYVWEQTRRGWEKCFKPGEAVVQIAGIHVICDEEAPHGDTFAAGRERRTRTKEIEM